MVRCKRASAHNYNEPIHDDRRKAIETIGSRNTLRKRKRARAPESLRLI